MKMIKKFQAPVGPISKIVGKSIVLIGDDIDTDRIIPARFLKCVNFDNLGQSVFEDDRKNLKGKHPFDLEPNKGSSILIVNSNFGCGSSREHAPQALLRWGIRAIIGESFAEIFYCNCIAIGIPCFTLPKALVKNIQENINSQIDSFDDSAPVEIGSDRLTDIEESIDSFNVYRVQVNQSLLNLREELNELELALSQGDNE